MKLGQVKKSSFLITYFALVYCPFSLSLGNPYLRSIYHNSSLSTPIFALCILRPLQTSPYCAVVDSVQSSDTVLLALRAQVMLHQRIWCCAGLGLCQALSYGRARKPCPMVEPESPGMFQPSAAQLRPVQPPAHRMKVRTQSTRERTTAEQGCIWQ
jgi:hypothetical protein